jgi:hypothetical protein
MRALSTTRRPGSSLAPPAWGATRIAVATLGTLIGLAGVEHGIGEILQGPLRPASMWIESWPDAPALAILAGEPAMTVIPNLLVTGGLSVAVGVTLIVWAIGFTRDRRGALMLIGLSVLLLLVGGGLAPPIMGIVVGGVATRVAVERERPVGRVARAIGRRWPWFLVAAVLGYLALVPGMPLASMAGVASEALVLAVGAFAFANFALALFAVRAYDRAHGSGR